MDWLSIARLSKETEIPETTTRRYVNNFKEYFRSEQIGRGKKFHPESIEVLLRIAKLYSADYETIEIKKILANEYAIAVEGNEDEDNIIHPPAYNLPEQVRMFQQQQEKFNKELVDKLQEQQKYIKELVVKRDKEIQELSSLESLEEKRVEYFDKIMAEHKVKKRLEEEALILWYKKTKEERTKRVGLFGLRKEEDLDARKKFVRKYIDEHFEVCLKREFDIG